MAIVLTKVTGVIDRRCNPIREHSREVIGEYGSTIEASKALDPWWRLYEICPGMWVMFQSSLNKTIAEWYEMSETPIVARPVVQF